MMQTSRSVYLFIFQNTNLLFRDLNKNNEYKLVFLHNMHWAQQFGPHKV